MNIGFIDTYRCGDVDVIFRLRKVQNLENSDAFQSVIQTMTLCSNTLVMYHRDCVTGCDKTRSVPTGVEWIEDIHGTEDSKETYRFLNWKKELRSRVLKFPPTSMNELEKLSLPSYVTIMTPVRPINL